MPKSHTPEPPHKILPRINAFPWFKKFRYSAGLPANGRARSTGKYHALKRSPGSAVRRPSSHSIPRAEADRKE